MGRPDITAISSAALITSVEAEVSLPIQKTEQCSQPSRCAGTLSGIALAMLTIVAIAALVNLMLHALAIFGTIQLLRAAEDSQVKGQRRTPLGNCTQKPVGCAMMIFRQLHFARCLGGKCYRIYLMDKP